MAEQWKKAQFSFHINLALSIPNLMVFIVAVHWKLSLHMCKEMFLSMKGEENPPVTYGTLLV